VFTVLQALEESKQPLHGEYYNHPGGTGVSFYGGSSWLTGSLHGHSFGVCFVSCYHPKACQISWAT